MPDIYLIQADQSKILLTNHKYLPIHGAADSPEGKAKAPEQA